MVTTAVADAIGDSGYLEFDPIGEVDLKGFPQPVELFVARAAAGPTARRGDTAVTGRPDRVLKIATWVCVRPKEEALDAPGRGRCAEAA